MDALQATDDVAAPAPPASTPQVYGVKRDTLMSEVSTNQSKCHMAMEEYTSGAFFEEKNYGRCLFCLTQISSLSGPYNPVGIVAVLRATALNALLCENRTQQRHQLLSGAIQPRSSGIDDCCYNDDDDDNDDDSDDGDGDEDERMSGAQTFESLPPGLDAYYCQEICWYLHTLLVTGTENMLMQSVYRLKPAFSLQTLSQTHPQHYELFYQLAVSTGKNFSAVISPPTEPLHTSMRNLFLSTRQVIQCEAVAGSQHG
jgi:hypothetical protein